MSRTLAEAREYGSVSPGISSELTIPLREPTPVNSSKEANKPVQPPRPKVSPKSIPGVGGDNDNFIFKIGVLASSNPENPQLAGGPGNTARMELAPARRSHHEKATVQPPGAQAGLELRTRANITKLNVPASRPIYQHFGISEETLEWVGAFIGTDVEDRGSAGVSNLENGRWRDGKNTSAWDQSQELLNIFRQGRELGIELSWPDVSGIHQVGFEAASNTLLFTGFIKEITRAYATEQRVYYRVVFTITNRQDINRFSSKAKQINLPKEFKDSIDSADPDKAKKLEADARNLAATGGYSTQTYQQNAKNIGDGTALANSLEGLSKERKAEVAEALQVVTNNLEAVSDSNQALSIFYEDYNRNGTGRPADRYKISRLDKIKQAEAILSSLESDSNLKESLPPEIAIHRAALSTIQAQVNTQGVKFHDSQVKSASPSAPTPTPTPVKPPLVLMNSADKVNKDPNARSSTGSKL